jgi:hypothetical protein
MIVSLSPERSNLVLHFIAADFFPRHRFFLYLFYLSSCSAPMCLCCSWVTAAASNMVESGRSVLCSGHHSRYLHPVLFSCCCRCSMNSQPPPSLTEPPLSSLLSPVASPSPSRLPSPSSARHAARSCDRSIPDCGST